MCFQYKCSNNCVISFYYKKGFCRAMNYYYYFIATILPLSYKTAKDDVRL